MAAQKAGMVRKATRLLICWIMVLLVSGTVSAQEDILVVGREGNQCAEDTCINRLHHAIPMNARARAGQMILFRTRNAGDYHLDPASRYVDPRGSERQIGAVHPLTGPVYIEGASAGDTLKVTILDIAPGSYGYTRVGSFGLIGDQNREDLYLLWRLNRTAAETPDIPGVRIPNASFPGVVTVLPGPDEVRRILDREAALAEAGGAVMLPSPDFAVPAAVCGPQGKHSDECLRTFPPREHGGNLDIRYLGVGVTIYLPCYMDGCGLAIGDVHFAQGDGEVSGTAIEMDSDTLVSTEVIKGGQQLTRGPHYEGPAHLLDIPSRRFHATTGFPLKQAGEIPPNMLYLDSPKIAALENLSNDISLAARNALLEMVDYIMQNHGLTQAQAIAIASVAVDLRIGQVVDAPNVGVTAILPLDIFADEQ